MAYLLQCLRMLSAVDRLAPVRTQQRERELAADLVPQLLELDRCQHVAGVPKKRDHLAISPNRPSPFARLAYDRTHDLAEGSTIDLPRGHERRHRLGCVEHDQHALPARLTGIDARCLQLRLEGAA